MSTLLLLIFALHVISGFSIQCSLNTRPTVTIKSGTVAGTTTTLYSSSIIVNKFLGILFGAPRSRFSLPQPPQSWHSTYDASENKPACIQQFNCPEILRNWTIKWFIRLLSPLGPAGKSEDCLNLNVFAPATRGSKAVLSWLLGGGFNFDSGYLPLYDGPSFAANQDVVEVTLNYRTNVFGFLERLNYPRRRGRVHNNIAAFGGNPSKVTLVRESAGGGSVDAAAIMQSGQATVRTKINDTAADWSILVEAVDCSSSADTLQCVHAISVTEIKGINEHLALRFDNPVPDDVRFTKIQKQRSPCIGRRETDEARITVLARTILRNAYDYLSQGPKMKYSKIL